MYGNQLFMKTDPIPIRSNFFFEPTAPIEEKFERTDPIQKKFEATDPIQKKFEATDPIPIRSKKNFGCADPWLSE